MKPLSRRGFVTGSACLAAAGSAWAQVPLPDSALKFKLVREGSEIGRHQVTFTPAQDNLTVTTNIDIVVKMGFITLYRFGQQVVERWVGGQFGSADVTTNDDGTKLMVSVQRDGDHLLIDSSKRGRLNAPANAMLATYWNRAVMDGPIIGTQDGRVLAPHVTARDWEPVSVAPGKQIDARHYVLTGDLEVDLWYDHDDRWRALQLKGPDNSLIRYVLA